MGEDMKCGREILGLLLIAALAMATLATGALAEVDHASSPLATPAQPIAGCHAHGGTTLPDSRHSHSPRPTPVSYQCCLTGHDAAVLQTSHSPQPSAQCSFATLQVETALMAYSLGGLDFLMVLSANPPGSTPLRI
jgi:hypothetical protein